MFGVVSEPFHRSRVVSVWIVKSGGESLFNRAESPPHGAVFNAIQVLRLAWNMRFGNSS